MLELIVTLAVPVMLSQMVITSAGQQTNYGFLYNFFVSQTNKVLKPSIKFEADAC